MALVDRLVVLALTYFCLWGFDVCRKEGWRAYEWKNISAIFVWYQELQGTCANVPPTSYCDSLWWTLSNECRKVNKLQVIAANPQNKKIGTQQIKDHPTVTYITQSLLPEWLPWKVIRRSRCSVGRFFARIACNRAWSVWPGIRISCWHLRALKQDPKTSQDQKNESDWISFTVAQTLNGIMTTDRNPSVQCGWFLYVSMTSSARSLVLLFAWHPCSSMTHGLLPAGATRFDITISPHWFIPGRTFRPESSWKLPWLGCSSDTWASNGSHGGWNNVQFFQRHFQTVCS